MRDIDTEGHQGWTKTDATPSWVYSSNYWYWTMSKYFDSTKRPVITIKKSAIN